MIYTKLTQKAMKLAFEAHKDQLDKSGVPYIFHPMQVAQSMQDECSTCAALLHDVVEDTDWTIGGLREQGFPKEVLDALRLLTHEDAVPYLEYIAAVKQNPIARAVKLSDLAHNSDLTRLDTVDEKTLARVEKYRKARELLEEAKPREMRRNKQALSDAACEEVLLRATNGVLAVQDADGYPYTVPLSYVYLPEEQAIYFHCAKQGHKLDAIAGNNRVSFCVVDRDEIIPEKFTTYYRSVVVRGRAQLLTENAEKERTVRLLTAKYAPDAAKAAVDAEVAGFEKTLCMVKISVEQMTGKQALELAGKNKNG